MPVYAYSPYIHICDAFKYELMCMFVSVMHPKIVARQEIRSTCICIHTCNRSENIGQRYASLQISGCLSITAFETGEDLHLMSIWGRRQTSRRIFSTNEPAAVNHMDVQVENVQTHSCVNVRVLQFEMYKFDNSWLKWTWKRHGTAFTLMCALREFCVCVHKLLSMRREV